MSEPSNGAWPFQEIPEEEGLDISAIFGDSSAAPQGDPFAPPAAAQSVPSSPTPVAQEITPAVAATSQPTTAPIAKAPVEAPAENPIAAAFEQKTAENTKKGLLEKPPVFYHKGVKEEIDDPSMTFEELRIRKSDDFTDLEEGKRVSWSVEYCGIRKEVKDPKGTTIISMKEMIERSREFLDALKKTKDKAPCCYVKPKVEMKTKGNAAYKGKFGTLEEARNSDKVICLIPSNDGRIYELRKMEQGEFIAPKKNVVDFSEVRAGFSPALPKIPAELMGQIIAFFRAFMTDHGENEAFAQIYWDKAEKRFFAYVPKQSVCKEEVEADLHDCLYDDEERYLCYADIHSHNSMDAFFSGKDDQDERSTGLYREIDPLELYYVINQSYASNDYLDSGFLPEHCLHLSMSATEKYFVLWNPELRADVIYGDKEYPNFPIPRMVFGVRVLENGKVAECSMGVVADEAPTMDTPMFFYPFSNVHSNDRVCTGNNVLPRYRKISALKNFPRYLLGLPDNDDMYDREHNRLKLSHGELLEHLKDKDPAYYYTDILVSNGKTLGDFISRR